MRPASSASKHVVTAPAGDNTRHHRESAHDRLLKAASVLFYNDGIGATGIDAIVQRAGVAKKSLYNNFSSKAELVAEYLQARHLEWLALYEARLAKVRNKGPVAGVLAVFDAYADHAEDAYERGFRGCGLLNAAAEFPTGDAGRTAVRLHKEEVESIVRQHLDALLPHDRRKATELARHLCFLLEGAIVRAGLEGRSDCMMQARKMAATLLKETA